MRPTHRAGTPRLPSALLDFEDFERRALLEAHRDDVAAKLAEQQALLAMIEKKVLMYQERERGRGRGRGG